MIFAAVPPQEAEGATLAHSVALPKGRIAKGTVLGPGHVATLSNAGVGLVEVALAEPGDVHENGAAARIAVALTRGPRELAAERATAGRVNLRAASNGLFLPDRAAIDRLNAIDPRVGLATLPDATRVGAGELVATLKIVPFFLPELVVEAWGGGGQPALRVARWVAYRPSGLFGPARVAHISTTLPNVKESVLDKTRRVFADRLAPTGAALLDEVRVPHEREALARALRGAKADLVVVFGASAVTDERDVVPAAITMAGGRVERVGMPVDPGNLLVLSGIGDMPVLGAPGCARSPARNGFDLVLDRLIAGVPVASADIAAMGVGGLLKEAPRPQPREGDGPGRSDATHADEGTDADDG